MLKAGKSLEYVFPFEKLEVYHLAIELADCVLKLLESFPPNKYFRLIGQQENGREVRSEITWAYK